MVGLECQRDILLMPGRRSLTREVGDDVGRARSSLHFLLALRSVAVPVVFSCGGRWRQRQFVTTSSVTVRNKLWAYKYNARQFISVLCLRSLISFIFSPHDNNHKSHSVSVKTVQRLAGCHCCWCHCCCRYCCCW